MDIYVFECQWCSSPNLLNSTHCWSCQRTNDYSSLTPPLDPKVQSKAETALAELVRGALPEAYRLAEIQAVSDVEMDPQGASIRGSLKSQRGESRQDYGSNGTEKLGLSEMREARLREEEEAWKLK